MTLIMPENQILNCFGSMPDAEAYCEEVKIRNLPKRKTGAQIASLLSMLWRISAHIISCNDFNPFTQPEYILLNLALGKNGGNPDNTKFPIYYDIDYVRVYQKK